MKALLLAVTLLLVRHAEKLDTSKDSAISAAGEARAQALVARLHDANISAIYATDLKRTQQTVKPLADALHLEIKVHEAKDTPGLVALLKKEQGTVLVAGHSNSLPEIAQAFGCKIEVSDDQFDGLFVVGEGTCIKLHQ
jgi:phosphohistidine phosphatase SixA